MSTKLWAIGCNDKTLGIVSWLKACWNLPRFLIERIQCLLFQDFSISQAEVGTLQCRQRQKLGTKWRGRNESCKNRFHKWQMLNIWQFWKNLWCYCNKCLNKYCVCELCLWGWMKIKQKIFFIYLFLVVLDLHRRMWWLEAALGCSARASYCGGFFFLHSKGSRQVGFSSYSMRTQ